MKTDYFIKHDVKSLDDSRIVQLVIAHHAQGYGAWWVIVEQLTKEETHVLSADALTAYVCRATMTPQTEEIRAIIDTCVKIGLLTEGPLGLYNERIMRQCAKMNRFRKCMSDSARKRWSNRPQPEAEDEPAEVPEPAPAPQEFKLKIDDSNTKREKAAFVLACFNKYCPTMPKVSKLTDVRVTHCNTLLYEFSRDDVMTVFEKAGQSNFLRGETGWVGCSFDWLINKSNFIKVLEGNYDNNRKITTMPKSTICNDPKVMELSKNASGGFDL